MNRYDVIVVGGGPAGMTAASRAAMNGKKVILLEKMKSVGRKLLITGKGRCNITNDSGLSVHMKHIRTNRKFLRNSYSGFFTRDLLELLRRNGLDTVTERGGRVFPQNMKSSSVVDTLIKLAVDNGVKISTGMEVIRLLIEDGRVKGVIAKTHGQSEEYEFKSEKVIVATGGVSYPATGSTGDGYKFAKTAGHKIIRPLPALVPVETGGEFNIAQKLQGLSLKNVTASTWVDGKKTGSEFGEMIFTHFGLSGPIILTLSRDIAAAVREKKTVKIILDLKPALDDKKLDARLIRELENNNKQQFKNMLKNLLPSKMIPLCIEMVSIPPEKVCHQITSQERKRLRTWLKGLVLNVTGVRPFSEAVITAGGVDLKEINPRSMESGRIRGLHFAGEVLDVDGDTGGYNLQIAFSTGWAAGG